MLEAHWSTSMWGKRHARADSTKPSCGRPTTSAKWQSPSGSHGTPWWSTALSPRSRMRVACARNTSEPSPPASCGRRHPPRDDEGVNSLSEAPGRRGSGGRPEAGRSPERKDSLRSGRPAKSELDEPWHCACANLARHRHDTGSPRVPHVYYNCITQHQYSASPL